MILKPDSDTAICVCLEPSGGILRCGYFHLAEALKEPGGSHQLPLMSEQPSHSS